jgi:leader peptidase (prepilin peptidase)/N-methyltransferase
MRRNGDEIRCVDAGDGIYVRAPEDDRRWRLAALPAALGVALGAVAIVRIGLTYEGLIAGGLLVVLTILAAIDLRWRVLPNRIVLPAIAVVLALQIVASPGRSPEWLLAALGAGALLLVPALARPGAIGMGDVKLAALLGAALGGRVLTAVTLGLVAVVPFALVVLVRRGAAARDATLPLGPFLAFGAAVVLIA